MKNAKNILIAVIIALLLLAGAFFLGQWYKKCPEPKTPIIERGSKEQVIPITPPVDIKAPMVKWRTRYIPGDVDSTLVNQLFKDREELTKRLDSMKVKSIVSIDTLWGEAKDTFKLRIDDFRDTVGLYVGLTPRKVQVETRTMYLPAPERQWWDNPYVPAVGGVVLGLIFGVAVK